MVKKWVEHIKKLKVLCQSRPQAPGPSVVSDAYCPTRGHLQTIYTLTSVTRDASMHVLATVFCMAALAGQHSGRDRYDATRRDGCVHRSSAACQQFIIYAVLCSMAACLDRYISTSILCIVKTVEGVWGGVSRRNPSGIVRRCAQLMLN